MFESEKEKKKLLTKEEKAVSFKYLYINFTLNSLFLNIRLLNQKEKNLKPNIFMPW